MRERERKREIPSKVNRRYALLSGLIPPPPLSHPLGGVSNFQSCISLGCGQMEESKNGYVVKVLSYICKEESSN